MKFINRFKQSHKTFRISKDKCALLVIDMQRYFVDPKSDACVPDGCLLVTKIAKLINIFSKNNKPIIFTRHIDVEDSLMSRWWKENLRPEDPMSEIVEDLDIKRGVVLIKHQYDAFMGTDLETILNKNKVKQVIICGVLTNLCCESTARTSFMKGFEVYFITDATKTYRREFHNATLLNLSYGFAVLLTINDVIKALQGC